MREWSVLIEAWAPADQVGSLDVGDSRVSDFADALVPMGAVVSVDQHRWSVRLTVELATADAAVEYAEDVVQRLAVECRFPAWPILRLEVVDAELLDAELEASNFPDLVSTAEACEILGVTRQRIHELRVAGRFPEPMVTLSGNPIWLRAAIMAFGERRNKKPGRPALRENEEGSGPNDLPNLFEGAHGRMAEESNRRA
jgi:predicted DNA-binding transcriptional regulator AlpA